MMQNVKHTTPGFVRKYVYLTAAFSSYLFLLFILTSIFGCKETDKQAPPTPMVTTPELDGVSSVTAIQEQQSVYYYEITSQITSNGGSTITEYGHVYSGSNDRPTLTDSTLKKGAYAGQFPLSYKHTLVKLKPLTTYYIRPFATNTKGTTYGKIVKLTTGTFLPELTTESHSVGESSIKITSILAKNSGGNLTQHGHLLLEGLPPTGAPQTVPASSQKTMLGTYTGPLLHPFTSDFANLKIGTSYSVYAYATNDAGTAYGELSTIRTAGSQDWAVVATNFPAPVPNDIGVSASGHIWMRGGMGSFDDNVYQLVSDKATGMTTWELRGTGIAALRCIAVAPDGTPWISNTKPFGQLTNYKNGKWQVVPMADGIGARPNIIDIAIGADGTMWVIGAVDGLPGFQIFKVTQFSNGQLSFERKTGLATNPNRIAVDPTGRAWVVSGTSQVWFCNGTTWTLIETGIRASDVSVSADGTVWLVGHLEGEGSNNDKCFRYNGTLWEPLIGGLQSWAYSISAGKTNVYTTSGNKIWSRSNAR